jgi:hypothetical protein
MGTEQLLIMRLENNLRSLRLKTKTLKDVEVEFKSRLERLLKINPEMARDLEKQFQQQMKMDSQFKSQSAKQSLENLFRK